MGGRKLHYRLLEPLEQRGMKLGRDMFIVLLQANIWLKSQS